MILIYVYQQVERDCWSALQDVGERILQQGGWPLVALSNDRDERNTDKDCNTMEFLLSYS